MTTRINLTFLLILGSVDESFFDGGGAETSKGSVSHEIGYSVEKVCRRKDEMMFM